MRHREKIITILTAIIMFAGATPIVPAQTSQTRTVNRDDGPPTPIKLGVMTAKQRKNSKRYNRDPDVPRLTDGKGAFSGGTGESFMGEELRGESRPLETYFRTPLCTADTVVVGLVKTTGSQLSEDERAIFTDHDVEVSDVIRNKSGARVRPNSTITVTRYGGRVALDNQILEYSVWDQKPLKTGKSYVLFLHYLRESDSFEPIDTQKGTLDIVDGNLWRLNSGRVPYQNNKGEVPVLLVSLRNTMKQCPK